MRIVVDTNILVSYLIDRSLKLRERVDSLLLSHDILRSAETFSELGQVLLRSKFDRYVPTQKREEFIQFYFDISEYVPVTRKVVACRDERDNMFLELAVCGRADLIITGDEDLLSLSEFEGVRIITLEKIP